MGLNTEVHRQVKELVLPREVEVRSTELQGSRETGAHTDEHAAGACYDWLEVQDNHDRERRQG